MFMNLVVTTLISIDEKSSIFNFISFVECACYFRLPEIYFYILNPPFFR
ncbi:MAG: hypothetical protein IJV35_05705 [Neisseriaceae bacterium]|nr:hypothetical protein [Neisseriaceae bacterium]